MKKLTKAVAALILTTFCVVGSMSAQTHNGHAYVDLGLPSGTLWATCNVGATTPEDYGSCYAWGETTIKSTYNWGSYKYANGPHDKLTKYCNKNDGGRDGVTDNLTKYCNKSDDGNNGFTDNLTELQAGDDPAAYNWGSDWRTPSKAQWDDLLQNTTNQWTIRNGVAGRQFTSKRNGQTLFLPAAGCRNYDGLEYIGERGIYWSSSLETGSPHSAWDFYFGSGNTYVVDGDNRFYGQSVRAVCCASGRLGNGSHNGHEYVDLGLPSGTLWATCNVGATTPEGYGNYYAWGETTTKSTYNWGSYKYANGNYDNLTELQAGDDPAAYYWGSDWRTPSKAQWDELLQNTTNQWTTRNGVAGRQFTSKRNGQTLFLPAAGCRYYGEFSYSGSTGYYWASSLQTDYPRHAWRFFFDSDNYSVNGGDRSLGFSVRPIRSGSQN